MKQKTHSIATALGFFKQKAEGERFKAIRESSKKQLTRGLSPRSIAVSGAGLVTMTRLWEAVRVNGSIPIDKIIPKSNDHPLTENSALVPIIIGTVKMKNLLHYRCSNWRSGEFIQFVYCFFKAFMCSLRSGFGDFFAEKLRSTLECLKIKLRNNEKIALAILNAIEKKSRTLRKKLLALPPAMRREDFNSKNKSKNRDNPKPSQKQLTQGLPFLKLKAESERLKAIRESSQKQSTNRLLLRPSIYPTAPLITMTAEREGSSHKSYGASIRRKAITSKLRPNLLVSLLILVMFGGIQAKSQTKALQIGDRLPNMVIGNIINSQQSTLHTADLDGKPLVLIFWNSGCRETREAMALVNAWAAQFAPSLQILTLAKEPAQSVKRNLLQSPLNAQFSLPVVLGDSLLKQLFPHHTHPHVVWLDKGLRVKSMSGIAELNPKNVSAFIKNSPVNWPQKTDRFDFKPGSSSLLDERKQAQPYYGMVSPYLQGVAPAFKVWIDSAAQSIHTQVINFPAYKIYLMAFGKFLGIPPNQVIWKVANKDQYVYRPSLGYLEEWQQQHYYCYESVWPATIPVTERLEHIRSDLNAALGLEVRMEQRDTTVLRLVATEAVKPSKGGKAMNLMEAAAPEKLLKNAGLGVLVYELNQQATNPPVIDETGFTGAVDMELDFDSFSNIQQINKALKPYHLKLEQAKRPVTFLVFEEEKGTKERIKD